MKNIDPYLVFNGDCTEAFEHYRSIFGGEFTTKKYFKDMPAEAKLNIGENEADLILYIALPIGKYSVLMGSDSPDSAGELNIGNQVAISIQADSDEEADKIFKGLTTDGAVTMPMAKTFWNAYFGMCVDKFGVSWMVNHDYESSEAQA